MTGESTAISKNLCSITATPNGNADFSPIEACPTQLAYKGKQGGHNEEWRKISVSRRRCAY